MSSKTLRQSIDNIESMLKDIQFELKGNIETYENSSGCNESKECLDKRDGALLTTTELKQILTILNHCIVPKNEGLVDAQRQILISRMSDISYKISDILNVDIDDEYYDVETLELKKY